MIELLWAVRHIREAADAALEVDVLEGGLVLECGATERQLRMPHRRGIVVERPHPHPFQTEALHVEIGDAKLGFQVEEAGLRQQLAELVDRPLDRKSTRLNSSH